MKKPSIKSIRKNQRHLLVWNKTENLYLNSKRKTAHWLWKNHVKFVAIKADELSQKYGANKEKTVSGALLHDLADVWVGRDYKNHDKKSKIEARKVLHSSGFNDKEIKEIVDKIIAPHSCYPGNKPKTLEGQALATADALAHLETNFYSEVGNMLPQFGINLDTKGYYKWVVKKLKRDISSKIFFSEEKEKVYPRYKQLLSKYSSP